MGLDLVLVAPLILLALLGFRDGMVRKIVGIVTAVVAMYVAQEFRSDVGNFLAGLLSMELSVIPSIGFLAVFFGIIFIQSLLYRLLTRNFKIGGIADRILGSVLGLFQGMLIVSVLLMVFTTAEFPSRQTKTDSRLYKPIVNIAPQIMDFLSTMGPEARERIDEMTKPQAPKP
ncbi:MAG: CvpA family protein [Ignavibacteria bacterium]|nr:CvpA family protein [Ignavibacteria bacterium]